MSNDKITLAKISDCTISRGNRLLIKNISLSISAGESLAILGPNGVGKTSFLRSIVGLENPEYGKIHTEGGVAFLPQNFNLLSELSAIEMILLGRVRDLKWYEYPNLRDLKIAQELLELLSMDNMESKPFSHLSGGQKQMVMIAQAIISGSKLLVLDEPSSALDLKNQVKLFKFMKEIRKQKGISLIFSTHDPNLAYHYSNKVVMIGFNSHIYGISKEVMDTFSLKKVYEVKFEKIVSKIDNKNYFLNVNN